MSRFLLTLNRFAGPWPGEPIRTALDVVWRHLPRSFPLKLHTGPKSVELLERPERFDVRHVPPELVTGDFSHVRLHGADGVELSVSQSRDALSRPTVTLSFPADVLPDGPSLRALFIELGLALGADGGFVSDEDTLVRDDLYQQSLEVDAAKLPPSVFWMTWLGPAHLANVGDLTALTRLARVDRLADGSAVVCLQDERFLPSDATHEQRRVAAEQALDLPRLRAQFPRG
ncbi:MAG: hypothetical protein ACOZQL_24385 [Myxococcota bacterium]